MAHTKTDLILKQMNFFCPLPDGPLGPSDKGLINSSLINTIRQSFFGCFVCPFKVRSENNDVICDIKIAGHAENSLPEVFMKLV